MRGHGVEESEGDGEATDETQVCTDSEKKLNRNEGSKRKKGVDHEAHEIGFPSPPRDGCPNWLFACAKRGREPMRPIRTEQRWKAGAGGKRRVERRRFTALSGLEAGKSTGFAHIETGSCRLGPDKSTQVVDFPHICSVRFFRRSHEMGSHGGNRDKPQTKRSLEPIWGSGADGMQALPCPFAFSSRGWKPSVRLYSPMFA